MVQLDDSNNCISMEEQKTTDKTIKEEAKNVINYKQKILMFLEIEKLKLISAAVASGIPEQTAL